MSLKDLLDKTKKDRDAREGEARRRLAANPTPSNGILGELGSTDPPSSPGTSRGFLLVSGGDPASLDFEQLARRQGHRVTRLADLLEVKDALATVKIDVAVLWEDVPQDQLFLLAATIRNKQPTAKLVAVMPGEDGSLRTRLGQVGVSSILAGPVPIHLVLQEATAVAAPKPDLTRFGDVSDQQIGVLENLLQVSGENRENLWLLGFAYYRAREFDRAAEVLERLVRSHPADAQGNYYLGSCYFRLGQKQKAVEKWQKVLMLAPNQPMARRAREHLDKVQKG